MGVSTRLQQQPFSWRSSAAAVTQGPALLSPPRAVLSPAGSPAGTPVAQAVLLPPERSARSPRCDATKPQPGYAAFSFKKHPKTQEFALVRHKGWAGSTPKAIALSRHLAAPCPRSVPLARVPDRTGELRCAPLQGRSHLMGTVPSCHLVSFGGPQAPTASPTPIFPASRCPAVGTSLLRCESEPGRADSSRYGAVGGLQISPRSCSPSWAHRTQPTHPPCTAARLLSGFICVPSFSSRNFQASARSRGRSVNDYRHHCSPRGLGAASPASRTPEGLVGSPMAWPQSPHTSQLGRSPALWAGDPAGGVPRGALHVLPGMERLSLRRAEFCTRPRCAKSTLQSDFPTHGPAKPGNRGGLVPPTMGTAPSPPAPPRLAHPSPRVPSCPTPPGTCKRRLPVSHQPHTRTSHASHGPGYVAHAVPTPLRHPGTRPAPLAPCPPGVIPLHPYICR